MKRAVLPFTFAIPAILGAIVSIGGCANGTLATIPPVPVSTLNAEATAIIADAEQLCGFEAEYASVINLIPVYGTDVTSAAADICAVGAAAVATTAMAVPQNEPTGFTALVPAAAKHVRTCRTVVHAGHSVKVCGRQMR